MTSSDSDLNKISAELSHLSLRRQQLLQRKKTQCIFQELRSRAEFEQTEEAASSQHEIDSIDDKLKQMAEKKAALQKSLENILNANDKRERKKEVMFTSCQKIGPGVPDVSGVPGPDPVIFFVEAPPSISAPEVILDVENLPACPCRTQCPECQQFIMTETFTSISSATWLVCFMTALTGCVAGCCLIPFCVDKFKSTTHRCPKCRTLIRTIKRL